MKKSTLFATLLAALFCWQTANVQAGELTVADGSATNSNVPYIGNQADRWQRIQMIYPKSNLADLEEKSISKITFYISSPADKAWNVEVNIGLAEVTESDFSESSAYKTTELTTVYSGVINGNESTLEITLDDSFDYSGEYDLLLDIQTTKVGSWVSATFAGVTTSAYQSVYGYNGSSIASISTRNRAKFLPKTTFTFEDGAPETCAKPTGVAAKEVLAKSATLVWDKVAEANWQYICLPAAEELDWADAAVKTTTDTFAIVEGLSAETNYKFYVRRYCSAEDQSKEVAVAFTTEKSCFAPTTLGVVEAETTSSSAKITWGASGKGETQYQYTYEVWGDEIPDWSNAVVTDQLEATLTGLNAATAYQVWVRSYCAADDQSAAETTYFATACGAINLPFAETFAGDIDCWTMKDCKEGYYASTGVSGGKFRFIYTSTPPQYLISPEFIASAKQVTVKFEYSIESSYNPESFKVGYSTTTIDLASFTWGDEITTDKTTVQEFEQILPAGVKYIAIQCTSDDKYYLYIDNFSVEEYDAPACAEPTDLAANDITATSATISWVSEAANFEMEVSIDGGEYMGIDGAIASPYSLPVTENTTYAVRVKAICGEDFESEWTNAVEFTTPCAVRAFGYTENFEGELGACWENTNTHGMNEWAVVDGRARYATTGNIFNHAELTSPWIAIETEGDPVLLFDWQNDGATAKLSIEAESEATVELQDLSEATVGTLVKLYLTEFKGKTVRFKFFAESSASNKYLYLDNFQVIEKPCLLPTKLEAAPGERSATVTWEAAWDETAWNLRYRPTGEEPEADWTNVADLAEATYMITELGDEKEYEVQVQAACGGEDWTASVKFTTTQATAIDNAAVKAVATKRIVNGQLIIELGGEQYNAQGVSVK